MLLPEFLTVTRSPVQLVGVDLLVVFFEGGQYPVVSLQDFDQEVKVIFEHFVFDVLSELVVDQLEQVVVD
jgi:hypothetical protein